MDIAQLIGKVFGVVASKTTEDALTSGSPSDLHLCDDTGEIVFNNKRFGGAVQNVEVKQEVIPPVGGTEGGHAEAPVLIVEFARRKISTPLPLASPDCAGLMSASDKATLDNLADMKPVTAQELQTLIKGNN